MSVYPKRQQIYLSEELSRRAVDEAKARGVSIAAVIREALTEYLAKRNKVDSEDPIWKIPEISETYESQSAGDLSSRHDEYLYGRAD